MIIILERDQGGKTEPHRTIAHKNSDNTDEYYPGSSLLDRKRDGVALLEKSILPLNRSFSKISMAHCYTLFALQSEFEEFSRRIKEINIANDYYNSYLYVYHPRYNSNTYMSFPEFESISNNNKSRNKKETIK